MPSPLLDALSIMSLQCKDDLVVDVHKLRFEKYQCKESGLDPRLKEVLKRRQEKQNAAAAELEAMANTETFAMQARKHRGSQHNTKKVRPLHELFQSKSNSKDEEVSASSVSRQDQLQKEHDSQKQTPKQVPMTTQRPMQSEREQGASEKRETSKKKAKTNKTKSRGEDGTTLLANEKSQLQGPSNIVIEPWRTHWQNEEGDLKNHPSEQSLTTCKSQEMWNACGQNQQNKYAQKQHDHLQQQLPHGSLARYDRTPSPPPRMMSPTAEGCRRMELLLQQQAQPRQHYDGQQQQLSWQSWEACDDSQGFWSCQEGDLGRAFRKTLHLTQFQPIQYGVRGDDGLEDLGDMYE
eukprot:TRINITY_DN1924_c0_g2_i2.p1 TRINITY_DN1924_c0_g2~~TRINITY_DN1924_c0_g2_i2.p1  ORF type:complete len:350 (+),score=77.08 TRINITY_DN1924_c0_g2_i2:170-1219(+)